MPITAAAASQRSAISVDFGRQLEIQVADALHAVGIQIDHDFVPHVEPFRMVVHGLRHQRHLRHFPEGGRKILTLKCPVELAICQTPAFCILQVLLDLGVAQFLCWHGHTLPNRPADRLHYACTGTDRQEFNAERG